MFSFSPFRHFSPRHVSSAPCNISTPSRNPESSSGPFPGIYISWRQQGRERERAGERKWIRVYFWECWSTLLHIYRYTLSTHRFFPYITMYYLWRMFMCKTHYTIQDVQIFEPIRSIISLGWYINIFFRFWTLYIILVFCLKTFRRLDSASVLR
jgi:hypothetical protein